MQERVQQGQNDRGSVSADHGLPTIRPHLHFTFTVKNYWLAV